MKCLLKILGSSEIHWKGYKITHEKMAALTRCDCQKWQFVLQLLLHQEFKQLGNATRHCQEGRMWTPQTFVLLCPRSGILSLVLWLAESRLHASPWVQGEGGWGNKYSIDSAPCTLDLSQDLRSGSFSKHIKYFRAICFTWLMSTTDSDRENIEIPATTFHHSGVIYISESSRLLNLNILGRYHWDGLPSPMFRCRMGDLESLSYLSEVTCLQDIGSGMWTQVSL